RGILPFQEAESGPGIKVPPAGGSLFRESLPDLLQVVDVVAGILGAQMEIGIYSFADLSPDVHTGRMISPTERMRDVVEEIVLADQLGLDVYGLGEHHRPDFISSAPAVALAAGAARTKRIRLTSAVSVLSSDDPVRVYQDFAML